MRLIGVEVQGYRRFADRVSVRFLEDLVALVGQNEAGKTSFLEALEEFNTEGQIEESDQTRRADIPTKIQATFNLEEGDWKDLRSVDGGEEIEQCTLTKKEDGTLSISLDPKPEHDLKPRKEAYSALTSLQESEVYQERVARGVQNALQNVVSTLESEDDYLGDENLNQIQELAEDLKNVVDNLEEKEDDTSKMDEVVKLLGDFIEHERNSPPHRAREILLKRRPKFLIFDEADRNLKPTYDLKEEVPNPPQALENLAQLADLDLGQLRDAVTSRNIAFRDDLREDANDNLKEEFSKAWVREDVVPVLSVDGNVLHINVRTPDERNRAPIDQRSDGLRWFVALLAFLNQKNAGKSPILLVDEAESHLSYDAQAELIEVLETQTVAQKVIYTTHSAGCLPSDLGRGIRPVVQLEGERSDIKNGFWVEEPGFKPIMVAMGLNPVAFTVARNALIAEGPSETILLPTLIRQATDQDELGYQVAPGAANVGEEKVSELLSETGRSMILLDGDNSGEERRDALVDVVDSEKVRTLQDFPGEQIVFEDLIDAERYVEAVNEELQTWQDADVELQSDDLPEMNRVEAVDEWCEENDLGEPMKTDVCQRLVRKSSNGETVVDSSREEVLEEIDEWVNECFVSLEG